jgi:hypothetical protein
MKALALATATVAFSLFVTIQAHAVPINGEISVSGSFQPIDSNSALTTLDAATGIDFREIPSGTFGTPTGNFRVEGVSGDFTASISFNDIGEIADFQFNPFNPIISDFWTIDTFSFSLTTISIDEQSPTELTLTGTGTISSLSATFDNTPGSWILTGQTLTGATFSWSSTTATPEPGTLALLGTGIAGISLRYKRRKRPQVLAA